MNSPKILFVGQKEYFRQTYNDAIINRGDLELAITSGDPSKIKEIPNIVKNNDINVVITFRPEWFENYRDTLQEIKRLGAKTVAYSTEPIPLNGTPPHKDQILRLENLSKIKSLDFDMFIHFDESSSDSFLSLAPREKSFFHPLPVSKSIFSPERNTSKIYDICFLGRSSLYREEYLGRLKSIYNVIHVAHGATDEMAADLMGKSKIILNLHSEDYLNTETRILQALSMERVVVSEPLTYESFNKNENVIIINSPNELFDVCTDIISDRIQPSFRHSKYDFSEIDSVISLVDSFLYKNKQGSQVKSLSHN